MKFTFEGKEYQIAAQHGGSIELTTAFRKIDYNHIEIIKTADYKDLGTVVYAEKICIHMSDFQVIASMLETESRQTSSDGWDVITEGGARTAEEWEDIV